MRGRGRPLCARLVALARSGSVARRAAHAPLRLASPPAYALSPCGCPSSFVRPPAPNPRTASLSPLSALPRPPVRGGPPPRSWRASPCFASLWESRALGTAAARCAASRQHRCAAPRWVPCAHCRCGWRACVRPMLLPMLHGIVRVWCAIGSRYCGRRPSGVRQCCGIVLRPRFARCGAHAALAFSLPVLRSAFRSAGASLASR